jgi:glucose-6-phosphate isomerase
VLIATVGGALPPGWVPGGGVRPDVAANGPLGAHFLAWEYATAIASRIIGVEPFDQPNVAESKENTNRILAEGLPAESASFTDGAIEVYAPEAAGDTVVGVLRWLADQAGGSGYLAVMAYLDRFGDSAAAELRPLLAKASGRPVTFGWAPRFLHSTGQYHKGGPQVGVFLQLTGAVTDDLAVPGRPYTFGELIAAQAAGDRQALAGRNRPLVRVHLTDRVAGLAQLREAAASLGG